MNNRIVASLCFLCGMLIAVPAGFSQGSLTPPGAPAPTMLTLSQVEPRTPITNTTGVVISTSGSYYLTANITVTSGSAIAITANGVTLDLNGFTLSSTSATASAGIRLATGLADIAILNGHITGNVIYSSGIYSGGGFSDGIDHSNPVQPFNVRVANVSISGCQSSGINLGTNNSTVVDSCSVNTVGAYGILSSTVTHSTAYQCGGAAIAANIASDCYGYSTGGAGLVASFTANNCSGISSTDTADGLDANTANNCYGITGNSTNGTGNGLSVNVANNCYGDSSYGDGVYAQNANNCYGQSGFGYGLFANIAIGSYGNSIHGTGIKAYIANSCQGVGFFSNVISNKYNMP
jgi:hypothetical protein